VNPGSAGIPACLSFKANLHSQNSRQGCLLQRNRFFLTLYIRCASIRPASRKCFDDCRERLEVLGQHAVKDRKKPQGDAR